MVLTGMEEDYEALVHFTPTQAQRDAWAKSGVAMPDGSFFIRNRGDLSNAILATGRATPNAGQTETQRRDAIRRHIMKRARALKLEFLIPKNWNSDGSLKQDALDVDAFLAHFGVLGMKWGVHRSRSSRAAAARGKASTHIAPDAAKAIQLKGVVKKGGTNALSNQDLQTLVTRMSLESQYGRLNQQHVSEGRKMVEGVLKDSGKSLASQFIIKYAPKGAAWVAKRAIVPAAVAVGTMALRKL